MKNAILFLFLMIPALASAQAYKCIVGGVAHYQPNPCPTDPAAKPLDLKIPSAELQAKMQAQEKARDKYWSDIKQAEAEKQQAENAQRAERQRQAYNRELDRERQVINARQDQLWQEHQQNRIDYECDRLASYRQQGPGCPPIPR